MDPSILKPLAVFCSDPESQRYIKSVRNLVTEERTVTAATDPDGPTVVETTLGLSLSITYKPGQRLESDTKASDIESVQVVPDFDGRVSEPPLRHYCIRTKSFPCAFWRREEDAEAGEEGLVAVKHVLSEYPVAIHGLYEAWMDTYSDRLMERPSMTHCPRPGVFPTVSEEVAWNVAGYLLAWRAVLGHGVRSVEFSTGRSKYMLKPGAEMSATLDFLRDQAEMWAREES